MPSTTGASTTSLRHPGLLEQTSTVRHDLGFYTAVCCAAQYQAPSPDVKLGPPILFAALRKVISWHAALSVSVVNEPSPDATFVRLPEVDLRRVVQYEQLPPGADRLAALNSAIETRLSTRFDHLGELPLWRLLVLFPNDSDSDHNPDVLLFIHHAIADGTSATIFHQALQKALDETRANEPHDSDPIVVPPALNFSPSLEDLHPLPVSYWALACIIWKARFSPSTSGLWTGKPSVRPTDCVRTRSAIHIVKAEALSNLLAVCKSRGISLQPLLESLFAHSIFTALTDSGLDEDHATKLIAECPINLRPYMSGDYKQAMGVYVASDRHEFKRNEDIWTGALRAKKSLTSTLKNFDRHVNTGLYRFAGDIRSHMQNKIGQPREGSFEVSNAGAIDPGATGGWTFNRVLFTQSGSVTGTPVQLSVCSVKGGCMAVGASWDGDLPEGLVDKIFKNFDGLAETL